MCRSKFLVGWVEVSVAYVCRPQSVCVEVSFSLGGLKLVWLTYVGPKAYV